MTKKRHVHIGGIFTEVPPKPVDKRGGNYHIPKKRKSFRKLAEEFFNSLFATGGEITRMPLNPPPPSEAVQMKPMRQHQERIIAGMGSGDSSDFNTYAKADALGISYDGKSRKYNMRDHTRLVRGTAEVMPEEGKGQEISAHAIADTMTRAYDRDPVTKKLKVKDSVPLAEPFTDQEIAAALKADTHYLDEATNRLVRKPDAR